MEFAYYIFYCVMNKEYVKHTQNVIPNPSNITKRDIPYTPINYTSSNMHRICFDHGDTHNDDAYKH